jgi:hypothetical protein
VAGDIQHAVTDRQLGGVAIEALGDLRGEGAEHQGAEDHHLEDPGAERLVACGEPGRQFDGAHRRRVELDVVAGQRLEHRLHQDALQGCDAPGRGDGPDHATSEEGSLGGVGRGEPRGIGGGQRGGHVRSSAVCVGRTVTRRSLAVHPDTHR